MTAPLLSSVVVCCLLVLGSSSPAQSAPAEPNGSAPFGGMAAVASQRTVVFGDITHYRFEVAVGPGRFDVIRIHRIVRESEPHRPVRTSDAVFLLPGAPNFFEAIFMPPLISSVPERDRSVAIFLAGHDIDVWGMDYGWALVPLNTTDFSFMKGWGVEKDAQLAEIALSIARLVRSVGGQDPGALHVLGFSYGVHVACALAGAETQRPPSLRNVKGLIPVDFSMKCKKTAVVDAACSALAKPRTQIDKGVYENRQGVDFFKRLGDLAAESPGAGSELKKGLSNYQALLFIGASTWILDESDDVWHFVAGDLDENLVPRDLRYTEAKLWMDLNRAVPPFLPVQLDYDMNAACCGGVDVPFDDHLGEISVPILYVGAAGGEGADGAYTATLAASKDVTTVIVSLQSDRRIDFAHADLFLARNAEPLVWIPILQWIRAHGARPAAAR